MRSFRTTLVLAVATYLTLTPAYAGQRGGGAHGRPTTAGKPSGGASTSTPTSTRTGSGSATTSTTPLNPIAAKISSHPQLLTRIKGMLPIDPATGKTMTL